MKMFRSTKGFKENFLVHDFNARHVLFLAKVLRLQEYSNCIHIGLTFAYELEVLKVRMS